jgi:2',3'-cyclic-nucleotide 2'-phosphodiesterase (5'-nucleotidase family)
VLLVDAGDALFRSPSLAPSAVAGAEARARVVLQEMGRMGYVAMAVGDRDLALGPGWLSREAAVAGVPLLSSNLADARGAHPFPATAAFSAAGRRVGLFGAIEPGDHPGGLAASDPAEAARRAVAELRAGGAEIVVGLLHLSAPSLAAVLESVSGIDVAVTAHDGQISRPRVVGGTLVVFGAERARLLGLLAIDPAGRGPWANAAAPGEALEELAVVERSLRSAEARLQASRSDADRAALADLVQVFGRRAEGLRESAKAVPEGRLYRNVLQPLDATVPDDPAAQRAVAGVVARWGDADVVPSR